MKGTGVIGVVLIVFGLVALAYQGISYTKRDTVLDIGPIHATADHTRTLPLPPIVGGVAVIGGILLLVMGARRA